MSGAISAMNKKDGSKSACSFSAVNANGEKKT